MFTLLIVLIGIIGILLTFSVLLQSGKGGGLAGIASGGATTQILGNRQAPDFLEQATWVLATAFIVLCILTNFAIDDGARESVIQQQAEQTAPAATLPPVTLPPPATDGGATTPPDAGSGN
ncbi:MAG: preprotein translocase subunit SecG [Rhodothermales bacterium]|jgi:preprotein translocase subunit SecG